MERARLSTTTKAVGSFPPVNVQITLTGAEDTWVLCSNSINADPDSNKASARRHQKINEIRAVPASIVSLSHRTFSVGVPECVCFCKIVAIKQGGRSYSQVQGQDERGR